MIEIKALALEDCKRISDIDASQHIGKAWREVDGLLQLVEIDYFDPSWPNVYETHLKHLMETVVGDGLAVGAFDHRQKMIGFVAVRRVFFGETAHYVLLDQLFITREARGKGLGRNCLGLRLKARGSGVQRSFTSAQDQLKRPLLFIGRLGAKLRLK